MARAHVVAASLLTLLGNISAMSTSNELIKGALVRRHSQEDIGHSTQAETMNSQDNSHVQLSPTGEMHLKHQGSGNDHDPLGGDPGVCNVDFPFTTADAPNDCTKGGTIWATGINDWADCNKTAYRLGFEYKGELNNTYTSAPPYAENCSVKNGEVWFNPFPPSENLPVSDLGGAVQVCMRHKYVRGQNNTDRSDSAVCPTDYEVVALAAAGTNGAANGGACHAALECMMGSAWCKTPKFRDNTEDSENNRPQGCYMEPPGSNEYGRLDECFGYNNQAPTGTVTGKVVCKISAATATAWETEKQTLLSAR